jgi:hypothetical protein
MLRSIRNITGAVVIIFSLFSATTSNASSAQDSGVGSTTMLDTSCPTDKFLNVGASEGAGAGYARPSLSVSCEGGTLNVQSNGIPHYTFRQITPNPLTERYISYQITLTPQYNESTTPIAILGPVALAINGLPIMGPNEAVDPRGGGYGDPIYKSMLDYCMGHTSPSEYHYHAMIQSWFFNDV